jgi:branched-chain amino acid transport system permease protein
MLNVILEGAIYGLALGMLYLLVALGLTIIFGMMDVVNFAHGAFITLGAFFGFQLVQYFGNFWFALLIVGLSVGILGSILERTLIRRLYGSDPILQLILTFGIGLIIEGFMLLYYGSGSKTMETPALLAGDPVAIGPAIVPRYRIGLLLLTSVFALSLWLVIQRSRLGLIVKAGIEDRERIQLLGIRIGRVNAIIFGIGSMLAGMAGLLAAPMLGISHELGINLLIISFIVVVIGGLGDIRGTIVSALVIGVCYNVTLFLNPGLAEPAIYLLMIVVLIFRPSGILGSGVQSV